MCILQPLGSSPLAIDAVLFSGGRSYNNPNGYIGKIWVMQIPDVVINVKDLSKFKVLLKHSYCISASEDGTALILAAARRQGIVSLKL